MDVRWQPVDRSAERQPKRGRAARFAAIILSAGILSGVAAMLGIWPFSGLQALATTIVHGNPAAPASASGIFPAVPPQHKTVDVYDPPASSNPRQANPPATKPPASTPPHDDSSPEPGDD